MNKLLSIVLSISILVSSVTPSLGSDSPGVRGQAKSRAKRGRSVSVSTLYRRVAAHELLSEHSQFRQRIASGDTKGLASYILSRPTRERAALLRSGDFVVLSLMPEGISPAQRIEAVSHYTTQLKDAHSILGNEDAAASLTSGKQTKLSPAAKRAQNLLADVAALSLVGTSEQASILVDFYKQAKDTAFEDTALLITARGLLRMQAYKQLGDLLHENAQNAVLSGIAAYIKEQGISVSVPQGLETLVPTQAAPAMVEFLTTDFLPNRLHADASLQATKEWMDIGHMSEKPGTDFVTQGLTLLPPTPGGFVQPIRLTSTSSQAREASPERADLHQKNTRSITTEGSYPEVMRDGEDDISVVDNHVPIEIGVEGFKLTVEDENKEEHLLNNVEVTVGTDLENFAREYNRISLDINGTFTLRDENVTPKQPDHFYFTLLHPTAGGFDALLEGASKIGLSRPLRIKIQHKASPKATATLPVFKATREGRLEPTQVVAEVDLRLLKMKKVDAEANQVLVVDGESLFVQCDRTGEKTRLRDTFFIRLPKGEAPYWTKILNMYKQQQFSLGVFSTKDKIPLIACWGSALHVGLGKTVSPVLKEQTTLGETTSTYIMMGINNVLPGLMVFINPLLERYGEARVYRAGITSFVLGGLLGTLLTISSLCGHGEGLWTGAKLATFLTSSTAIALGGSITGYLRGLLVLANSGVIRKGKSFVNAQTGEEVKVVYNTKHLLKRAKELFTKKGENSLVDLLNLQKTTMYKNLGTMAFLAFPWLTNLTAKTLFGVDLGLDFTASYVPYSLAGLYTLYKVHKTPLKNSFPLDVTLLRNKLKDLQSDLLPKVAQIELDPTTVIQTRQRTASELLEDAYYLSRFGTPEQAPVLLDVYNRVKDSSYNNEIVFHAARGLLRMGAYKELQVIVSENPQNAMLSGIAAYIKEQRLPVKVPQGMAQLVAPKPDRTEIPGRSGEFDTFDYISFYVLDNLDASLQGVKEWVSREPNQNERTWLILEPVAYVADPGNPVEETRTTTDMRKQISEIASPINDAIRNLVRMEARKDKKAPKELTLQYEREFGDALEEYLLNEGRSVEEVQVIRQQFREAFDSLNHRNIKIKDVIRKHGLPASLAAMTLATIGELGFSNNFAFAMRELLGDATTATGVVGIALYGFMFGWRLIGNFLTQRMSGGSMYALSSTAAVAGSMMMSLFPADIPVMITGAIISCFGISNFFAQMYNYIIKLHPEYKREVALLIQLSMPVAALCTPLLRLAGHIPGLDMGLVAGAMAGSVALTPKMLAGSSLVGAMKHIWSVNKNRVKKILNRRNDGNDQPPLTEAPAH